MTHFEMKLIAFNAAIFDADILVKSLKVMSSFVFVNHHVVNGGVAGAKLGCRDAGKKEDDKRMGLLKMLTLMRMTAREESRTTYNDVVTATVFGISRQPQANMNAGKKHTTKSTVRKHWSWRRSHWHNSSKNGNACWQKVLPRLTGSWTCANSVLSIWKKMEHCTTIVSMKHPPLECD